MNPVWKCKNCDRGPCYVQSPNREENRDAFGQCEPVPPLLCPYCSEESPEFELCAPEVRYRIKWCDEMYEWLSGPGYDNAPEEIRDGLAIELESRIDRHLAMRITGLLRNYEESATADFLECEEWKKELKKISKDELFNVAFPEGFKAGIIYGEMIRQRKAGKND